MPLVGKECSGVLRSFELITVMALHMDRSAAKKSGADERSHASRHMAELIIMSYGNLEPSFVRESDQALGAVLVKSEGLLHINVAPIFQAKRRKSEMAVGGRRDVNNVGSRVSKESCRIGEVPLDRESLVELSRHQGLAITDANYLAPLDSLNLRQVCICDSSAPHDGNLKHLVSRLGTL